jgi:2-oxoglutarate ferredoxin oxidoreductase subunit gamma
MWVAMIKQITVAGFGGQGVMLLGQTLAHAGNEVGLHTLWFPSYGPETRGGTANCGVTIADEKINSPVFSKADTLIALNEPSLEKFKEKVKENGEIIYNASLITKAVKIEKLKIYPIPANEIAVELGNIRVANMVMLGAYLALHDDISLSEIIDSLTAIFGERRKHLITINIKALEKGMECITSLKS